MPKKVKITHNQVIHFSISPIPKARPQVLLKNRTAKIIVDIATISQSLLGILTSKPLDGAQLGPSLGCLFSIIA
jgi:hypothetical protein